METRTSAELVTLDQINAARERIRPAARVTPLIEAPWPSDARRPTPDSRLFLKAESLQPMGAFKIRGAFNMVAQLAPEQLKRGVITYSSGNHGQAVAMAAQLLGAPAVIVMPTTAPAVKVEGAKSYGAEVQFAGTTSTERHAHAERVAAERGLTIIPPFDHQQIIAGQGTAGLEIIEQCPDVGAVYVPIGGGGLLSGVATAIKRSKPSVRVIGVEPEGAPTMKTAVAAGEPVSLPKTGSIADGLLTIRAGDVTFAHAREFVDEFVTVPDEAIAKAVSWLFRHSRLVVEPSGAAATAAVMLGLGDTRGASCVVAVVSGGNVAPEAYARYVSG
ncbi:MAG TPA: threonine/serine dehydratase [Vicinamibacterales bacterium]|nr:threonine/serine dehydratase [Vicinamibacterales bacterium]